jgi:hypothetical protein
MISFCRASNPQASHRSLVENEVASKVEEDEKGINQSK